MHTIELQAIKLIGITVTTSNAAEMHPETAKIGSLFHKFLSTHFGKIPNRKPASNIFAVYTNYESDASGSYTYFIGEEVSSFEGIDQNWKTLVIPPQVYTRLTASGSLPQAVIETWQKVWTMSPMALGGKRAYIADFEIYDDRSKNPHNATVDIYIGIDKKS